MTAIVCVIKNDETKQMMERKDPVIFADNIHEIASALYRHNFCEIITTNDFDEFNDKVQELSLICKYFTYNSFNFYFNTSGRLILRYLSVMYHHKIIKKIKERKRSLSPRENELSAELPQHQIVFHPAKVIPYYKIMHQMYQTLKDKHPNKKAILIIPVNPIYLKETKGVLVSFAATTKEISKAVGYDIGKGIWYENFDQKTNSYFAEITLPEVHVLI